MKQKLLNFVEQNKDKTWTMPTPPSGLNPIELTKWLFEQDAIGWIKLDVEFDLNAWKRESFAAEKYYVNHRDSDNYADAEHRGWRSCCIHGIDIDKTQAEESANLHLFHWTELANEVPTITKFWKEFPVEAYRRLRFMRLDAGGYIGVHDDLPTEIHRGTSLKELNPLKNTISINVAIVHPDQCDFVTENFGTVPITEGGVYIINITKPHCVVNFSNYPRTHIIAECVVGNQLEEFANLIYRSYNKEYGRY